MMNGLPFARLVMLAALALTPAIGHAQVAPGTVQSVVLNSLTATAVQDLDFGNVIPGTAAGTVTVDPASTARITTGGAILAGGAPSVAIFVGVAQPNRMVHLSMPNGSITLTNGSGGTMTVNNFYTDGAVNRRADANGLVVFRVAARLSVAANQVDGLYSGTFAITLNLH